MARSFASASSQYGEYAGAVVTAYPFTMAAWVYPLDTTTAMCAMSLANAAGSVYVVMELGGTPYGANITALVGSSGEAYASATAGYTANAWNHGAVVFTSSTSRAAYQNGGNKGTNTTSKTITGLSVTDVGALNLGGPLYSKFNGRIAMPCVWNVALTDAEIAALAAGVHPLRVRPTSIVSYWPLHGDDSPERDWTSNKRALTLSGSPTKANNPPVEPFSRRFWGSVLLIETGGSTTNLSLSASTTVSAARVLAAQGIRSATVVKSASVVRQDNATRASSVSSSGAVVRQTTGIRAASVAAGAAVVRQAQLLRAASVTVSAAVVRQAALLRAASAGVTAALVRQSAVIRTASVSATASLPRITAKALSASVSVTAFIIKTASRTLTAAVSVTASADALRARLVTLAASVSASASVTRLTSAARAGSASVSGTLARDVVVTLRGAVIGVPTVVRRVSVTLAASVLSAAAIVLRAGQDALIRVTRLLYRDGITRSASGDRNPRGGGADNNLRGGGVD